MLLSINEAVYDEYMQAAFENYDQRRQDLLHLAGFSERFESTEDFLSQLSLLGNTDDESAAADFSGGSVTLSTIHQAKGLEWSVVFLIGLCDGMFPHQRVIDDGDLAGLERRTPPFLCRHYPRQGPALPDLPPLELPRPGRNLHANALPLSG